MKIIIVGAGEVGTHLAKLLARENFDITLLDEDSHKLKDLESNYDLLTYEGMPTSIKDLREIQVQNADLFIAVTPYEGVNMTACMLANNLGAKKTLARIDNNEYLEPNNREFFQKLGVHHLINPEVLAAEEIKTMIESNWLRQKLVFSSGELILLGIKVRSNAIILDKKFNSGFFNHRRYRIVAIKRNNNTIIPSGNDEILVNDIVYFITNEENLEFVKEQAGKKEIKIENVMFMGGSRIATKAINLLPGHIKVKILEKDKDKSYALVEKCKKSLIINADARDIDVLREEGIVDMDAFVAVTSNSEANILACLAAKRMGVKKTIAEVENIDYIALAESMDIGTIINKKMIAASYIYQLTLDANVLEVKALTSAHAEVVEFMAKEGSKITKAKVKDIKLPVNVNLGGYIRAGEGYIVAGDSVIQTGDLVIVFCVASAIRKVENLFH